jgi:hypothetical protein
LWVLNNMAIERPPLDSYISAAPQRVGTTSRRRPLESYVNTPKEESSIYETGGAYDQFGPNTRAFNPVSKSFGKAGLMGSAADQPGSALPFVGQVVGNMAAGPMGLVAGGAGGVAGAVTGEGVRQLIGRGFGVQKGADPVRQLKAVGKNAAIAELTGVGLT